ncbi:11821_t:CDS:2, partial [Racocetra persica]
NTQRFGSQTSPSIFSMNDNLPAFQKSSRNNSTQQPEKEKSSNPRIRVEVKEIKSKHGSSLRKQNDKNKKDDE